MRKTAVAITLLALCLLQTAAALQDFRGLKPLVGEYVKTSGNGTGTTQTTVSTTTTLQSARVTVSGDDGSRISGVSVYAFTPAGGYAGVSAVTGSDGVARLTPTPGYQYKFRAQYSGQYFWSAVIDYPAQNSASISVPMSTGANVTVNVAGDDGVPLSGLVVYAYTSAGSYAGKYAYTSAQGDAVIAALLPGGYRFRTYYSGVYFWSRNITTPSEKSASIVVPITSAVNVTVAVVDDAGNPLGSQLVYAFTSGGSYVSKYAYTSAQGNAVVSGLLPGSYKFRTSYTNTYFWSGNITTPSETQATIVLPLSTAVNVTVTVSDDRSNPLNSMLVYAYSDAGSYVGKYAYTNAQGNAVVSGLLPGGYKFRTSYTNTYFWSQNITVPAQSTASITVPLSTTASVVVSVADDSGSPMGGLAVYAYSGAGSYAGKYNSTNSQGSTSITGLLPGSYNFRTTYSNTNFWSGNISVPAQSTASITIPVGTGVNVVVSVADDSGSPLGSQIVYAYSDAGSYAGKYNYTNAQGSALIQKLLPGRYRFRTTYSARDFWSANITTPAQTTASITVPVGASVNVSVSVADDSGSPMGGYAVYAFTSGGSSIGKSGTTNAQGVAVIANLFAGSYKFRTSYSGAYFWSANITVPAQTTASITVPISSSVNVTVTVSDDSGNPLVNQLVYAFTSSGSYVSKYAYTNSQGNAVIANLIPGAYKFRTSYGNTYLWSGNITVPGENAASITVPLSTAVNVVVSVSDDSGSPLGSQIVYAYSDAGSYAGKYNYTNAQGSALIQKLLPGRYRFRTTYSARDFWSANITTPAQTAASITVPLSTAYSVYATVADRQGTPQVNRRAYCYTASGSYTGRYANTNQTGVATITDVLAGNYKIRSDYNSVMYWSGNFTLPGQPNVLVTVG